MYTVIFVITYQVASQALAISEVTKDLALHWDTENVSVVNQNSGFYKLL